ncbi:pyoverdine maturation tyrosinase PvdP [Pseudomonas aeruginosa]|nr:pyoverdine maturation tyrosinase PvdP [Pseudomonas aeruginosa]AHC65556.1 chromophore maturation protein PvdP [Pseudomonas aeruginosa LES431]AHK83784.1 chromophore maturation protein PvdP [Pseudomonas aeruginosa LESlike5]AHK89686.1 chromophore maturation protein PvdP [Pseudomonas aeruginosa LESlike7]AHK95668.1 chromophore maturation protein PvdP [Pseudomonas aeruginosa LES400]AHL01628.1 chromophore maturation protein PvdP [Pseudomonas aeruginosa LESB65]
MTVSRRGFMAGLALTGAAALPVAYYSRRHLAREEEEPPTADEAVLDLADTAGMRLGGRLRGVWDLRLVGADAGLPGLPAEGLQMVLDVAPKGRGLIGYLDTPTRLLSSDEPRFRVSGDLVGASSARIRWRLVDQASASMAPTHDCSAVFDEVWDNFANAGDGTLSGHILRLDRSPGLPEEDFRFVAVKRHFPPARERIALNEKLLGWLVSPQHRLFHQLWHASRDKWHQLSEKQRNALRGVGWQPGPLDRERDARGPRKDRNASGIDFLFMHRHMLHTARSMQDLPSWKRLPRPAVPLEFDRPGFIRYFDNPDGFSVPPAWVAVGDDEYSEWLRGLKSAEAYHSNFLAWESQYQDPEYLAKLTLGQFGSEMELGMHDWLHMRWATVTRDPSNGSPVMGDRVPSDFSPRWFRPENDFLGDPFSSHVNPVFWSFHGWIDDRIEDWYRAHERFHPGEVRRREVQGIPWFAAGRWVEVDDPWLGPATHGCGLSDLQASSNSVELDVETMKLAVRIIFSEEDQLSGWLKRAPRRPWYARNLKLARDQLRR